MEKIEPFNARQLEAVCKVLGDKDLGLTGSEIGYILLNCRVPDVSPQDTKWRRLFNALAGIQNKHQVGNHLIMFINRALDPVKYARDKDRFDWRRNELNVVLSFTGFSIREDGKIVRTTKETTIKGARSRANLLKSALEDRKAHTEIYRYCNDELLNENYFHAVFEAIKGIAERIRVLSGLDLDGGDLVNIVFSIKNPVLAINALNTDSEKSEQKGFSNILLGLFGAIRNPLAHSPKIIWTMSEQDALDIFSLISFVHRRLDFAVKI